MKLLWHIAKKDLRRLWLPIALFAAVIAIKLGLGAVLLYYVGRDVSWFSRIAGACNVMVTLEVLVGCVLVAALVHNDVTVGTTAFWMTRPVSGARLLAAKLLVCVIVFAVVPLAITLPWWLVCDYGVRELFLAGAETVFWQALMIACSLPLAALTDGFTRYFLWSLVFVVALVLIGMTLLVDPINRAEIAQNITETQLLQARIVVVSVVLLVAANAAAVQQFCTRRLFRSSMIVVGGVALALVVFKTLSWNPSSPWNPSQLTTAKDVLPGKGGAGLTLEFREAQAIPTADAAELLVIVAAKGIPPDLILGVGNVEHAWTWLDGLRMERNGWFGGPRRTAAPEWIALGLDFPKTTFREWTFLAEQNERIADQFALLGVRTPQLSEGGMGMSQITVPLSLAARMRSEPPAYLMRGSFNFLRPFVLGEQPMRVGATLVRGLESVRIMYVDRPTGDAIDTDDWYAPNLRTRSLVHDARITLVERHPAVVDVLSGFHGIRFDGSNRWPDPEYFLVNRRLSDAVAGHSYGRTNMARIATVGISRRFVQFLAPFEKLSEGKRIRRANWYDGTTLATLELRKEESFTKELRVERFQLKAESAKGAR